MLSEKLKNYKLYLCSQSPRRQQLLQNLDINFMVASKVPFDETFPQDIDPKDVPIYLARKKALAYEQILRENRIIITADTVVIHNNKILGKPKNLSEAKQMLKLLSNSKHLVITGICIADLNKKICFSETTTVWFKKLTDQQIDYYVEKYKPLDKAGAYGIQEWIGLIGVEKIEGCFYNVVGLPVARLYEELEKFLEN